MAFCTKCGKQVEDGVKFCTSCGQALAQPQQPDAPEQPQQQNIQQTQPDANPPKDKKKKSKKPFIIGGGAVVAAALVCVLVFTNVFGLFNKANNGGNNNGVGYYIGGDDEDSYFFFDWETIEMFGGKEAFADWLMNVLELDAEDFYESLYGEYYMSPVGKVNEERGWLDGFENAANNHRLKQMEPENDKANNNIPDEWPAAYLPEGTPVYPDGVLDVKVDDTTKMISMYITVSNTSVDALLKYCELLKDSGWEMKHFDFEWNEGNAEKWIEGGEKGEFWTFECYETGFGETVVQLCFALTSYSD